MNSTLYIVIPCFNEEEILKTTAKETKKILLDLIQKNKISKNSKITFVNDGSKDKTWQIIKQLHSEDNIFTGIDLSANKGHQNALLAGLLSVKEYADMVISMDADLQDDVNAIEKMVDKFLSGYDIVYGVRSSREEDSFFKKFTAESFYKLINKLGAKVIFNHADFRLMSKRALYALKDFREVNLFLRGIVPMIGFNQACVEYKRKRRIAGESKYPLKKMLAFAIDGITSLSVKPIRIITALGGTFTFINLILLLYSLIKLIIKNPLPVYAVFNFITWFFCSVLIFSIGIVGEYIGKIYLETKKRPRYIIKQFLK